MKLGLVKKNARKMLELNIRIHDGCEIFHICKDNSKILYINNKYDVIEEPHTWLLFCFITVVQLCKFCMTYVVFLWLTKKVKGKTGYPRTYSIYSAACTIKGHPKFTIYNLERW